MIKLKIRKLPNITYSKILPPIFSTVDKEYLYIFRFLSATYDISWHLSIFYFLHLQNNHWSPKSLINLYAFSLNSLWAPFTSITTTGRLMVEKVNIIACSVFIAAVRYAEQATGDIGARGLHCKYTMCSQFSFSNC